MSRLFVASSSQALTHAAGLSTFPMSMHVWAKAPATLASDKTIISIGNSSSATSFLALILRSNGTIRLRQNSGGSPQSATSTGTVSTNQIFSVGGAQENVTTRRVYLNGVQDGTNLTVYGADPPSYNFTTIGRVADNGTDTSYYDGWIAEAAIWNATLTQGEWTALAAGANPLQIRPDLLWGYWPLFGNDSPEVPHFGDRALTLVNNPTKDEHPRVYVPGRSALHAFGAGSSSITGTGNLTIDAPVLSGTGNINSDVTGTGALTIATPIVSGSGTVSGGSGGSLQIEGFVAADNDFASTLPLTVNAGAGTNRLIYVVAFTDRSNATTINSATCNGVTMTPLTAFTHSSGYDARGFYLADDASTTVGNNSIVVTYSDANCKVWGAAVAYSGVNQTTPITSNVNNSQGSTNATWTIASTTGEKVCCIFAMSSGLTVTPGTGTTMILNNGGVSTRNAFIMEEDGQTSTVINATWSGSRETWGTAISINPSISGGSSIVGNGALILDSPVIAATGTVSSGPTDITGTGALSMAVPVLAGLAERVIYAKGGVDTLTMAAPVLAGTAYRLRTATGALTSTSPSIAGTGTVTDGPNPIFGLGAFILDVPYLNGIGTVGQATTGTGSLVITSLVTLAGTGTVTQGPRTHTGTGALVMATSTLRGRQATSSNPSVGTSTSGISRTGVSRTGVS